MIKLITPVLLSILLSACSAKKSNPRNLEVSFGALTQNSLEGGVIVKLETPGNIQEIILKTPPYQVQLPDGPVTIHFVGFSGPNEWQGATECGGTSLTLKPETVEIYVIVNATNCANEPYHSLIASKVSTWDSAKWDLAKWGP